MEADEQVMLQLWFEKLRLMLDEGDVDGVKKELDAALGRIEEDQRETGVIAGSS